MSLIWGPVIFDAPMEKKTYEIRIKRVRQTYVNELQLIASNLGISVSALLKPKLMDIIASYPESFRNTKDNE